MSRYCRAGDKLPVAVNVLSSACNSVAVPVFTRIAFKIVVEILKRQYDIGPYQWCTVYEIPEPLTDPTGHEN